MKTLKESLAELRESAPDCTTPGGLGILAARADARADSGTINPEQENHHRRMADVCKLYAGERRAGIPRSERALDTQRQIAHEASASAYASGAANDHSLAVQEHLKAALAASIAKKGCARNHIIHAGEHQHFAS